MSPAERRRWHRAFVQHIGRDATRMDHRDEDEMRAMRADGISPDEAARLVRLRLDDRHGKR